MIGLAPPNECKWTALSAHHVHVVRVSRSNVQADRELRLDRSYSEMERRAYNYAKHMMHWKIEGKSPV